MSLQQNTSYNEIVEVLKEKIKLSRIRLILTANIQLLAIYWEIGNTIAQQEEDKGWGAKIVEQLAKDLRAEFPDFKGLSPRNLRYMRDFALAWPELSILQQPAATIDNSSILQQPVAKLPWGHICLILDKLKSKEEKAFYSFKTVENNWSRSMLLNQIDSNLFGRQGKSQNNFSSTLPDLQSDLAIELIKDPYKFDFFQLSENARERDLENALVTHMSHFLVEMGKGFSYVGRQYHIEKGGKDYYIDLLLYHLKLHCYVVLELKIGEFIPEYAGKMNFYLSIIDDMIKAAEDKPSIGIILCKSKNKTTVEYALRDLSKPIGIAEYQLTQAIPENLKGDLPTIEELEMEADREVEIVKKPLEQKIDKLKDLLSKLNKPQLKKVKSQPVVKELFINVIMTIVEKMQVYLKEIMPFFSDAYVAPTIQGNSNQFMTSIDIDGHFGKDINTTNIGVSVYLDGFNRVGTKAFSLSEYLTFNLDRFSYAYGQDRNHHWAEKTYDDIWGEKELEIVAEKFAEIVIGKINEELEKIGDEL